MSSKKTKLELTWIGKEHRPRLEPRILLEEPDKSHHAKFRVKEWPQENAKNAKGSDSLRSSVANEDRAKVKDLPQEIAENSKNSDSLRSLRSFAANEVGDIFDNMLIRGDNLLGLKALEQEFAGKVKCVYIDPPYNTGSAFEHYDDGVEHSIWLSLIRERITLLRSLLSTTGTIWINLDDNEAHYCKVLGDEIFGRKNFLGNLIWEKSDSPRMDAEFFSSRHDHILVWAKDRTQTEWNRIPISEEDTPAHYDKVDGSGRKYYLKPLRAMGGQGDSRATRPTLYFALTAPDGTDVFPMRQDGTDGAWRWNPKKIAAERDRIDWIQGRNGWTPYYRIYADSNSGRPPETIWSHVAVGSNRTSKAEIKQLFPDLVPFGTPKPERMIQRVLTVATNPGDLVLDSFLGSGTTAAVAHKMGRRWIGIELGEHCETHCLPRLKKVVDGEDPGGITQAVGWKGGGGFRYYRLAPSLLEKDKWGNWVVSKEYNAAMLAEAVCKLEGFSYEPSDSLYWQHGHSTERDFIYTTTANLSHDQLQELSDEVGPERSLLVVCSAFRGRKEGYPNLTVKKIPNAVLTRCEWGKDDYSLKVENLPKAPPPPGQQELF
jgi:adenine-specific DNA-methyltransferase